MNKNKTKFSRGIIPNRLFLSIALLLSLLLSNTLHARAFFDDFSSPPTSVRFSLACFNLPCTGTIGTFSTTDPDIFDSHKYEILYGDSIYFDLRDSSLVATALFSTISSARTFEIGVRSTDRAGNFLDVELTLTIGSPVSPPEEEPEEEQPKAPVDILLSNDTIREESSFLTKIGEFTTVDEDSSFHDYELIEDESNGNFRLFGKSLYARESFDYEEKNSYRIKVRSTDFDDLFLDKEFTIKVTDVRETFSSPDILGLSQNFIDRKAQAGEKLCELNLADDFDDIEDLDVSLSGNRKVNKFLELRGRKIYLKRKLKRKMKKFKFKINVRDSDGLTSSEIFVLRVRKNRQLNFKMHTL